VTNHELKLALFNGLQVRTNIPGQPRRDFECIEKIIYCHHLGGNAIDVMAEIIDGNGESHREYAQNIELINHPKNMEIPDEIEIPENIKSWFKSRVPVKVTSTPKREFREINELEFYAEGAHIVVSCVFFICNKNRRVRPEDVERDYTEHSPYYHTALDFRDLNKPNEKENRKVQRQLDKLSIDGGEQ
jgi:hypothetical protein